ncbi:MAG: agmatinase family protein [Planctomycetota bacterium]
MTDPTPDFRPPSQGLDAVAREASLPTSKREAADSRALEMGLPGAESISDPNIGTFSRGPLPLYAGIPTMLKLPYVEDVRQAHQHDVSFMGVPFDIGTTFRPGTRFGPQGMRRASVQYTSFYSFEMGVDLFESLNMCDLGDVFTIGNIEKSFDQISRAVGHAYTQGTFPVIMGGDHSIGYPCVRGLAPHIRKPDGSPGKLGIIHIDRHLDTLEKDMDERMHTCPWFHATNIPNAPSTNLVQMGIGGWQTSREWVKGARDIGTYVLTMDDIETMGIEKAAEVALDIAWKDADAVYLSFDIDSVEAGHVPGTGWPQPGGFQPREVLKLLRLIASRGLAAMECVEVAPCYDIADVTSIMAVHATMEVLGSLVDHGHLPAKREPMLDADLNAWKGT